MKIISGFYNGTNSDIEVCFTIAKREFKFTILPNETRKPLCGKAFIPMFHFPEINKNVEVIYSEMELQKGWYTYLSENEIIWFDGPFAGIIIPDAKRDYLPELIKWNQQKFLNQLEQK